MEQSGCKEAASYEGLDIKPTLVAVAACLDSARDSEEDIVVQQRVWVGFIHAELEKHLEFINAGEADNPFGEHGGVRAVPFGPALVEVANENFNFMRQVQQKVCSIQKPASAIWKP